MKRIQFTILAVAILAGCVVRTPRSKSGPAKPSGPVLARVNDQTLTRDQLMILFRGQIPSDVPREKLQSVLESWVNGELWCQEAMRLGIGQDETTQLALRNEERNFIAHLLLARIQDTISVTDAEVYDYFTNNKDDYLNSTSISYLMFYDSALAEKVHERLAAGTDFASVAKDFSSDQVSVGEPTRYFLRNDSSLPLLQLSPELNRAIFRLNKGDISPVVRVSVSGKPTFWIVKCIDRRRVRSDVRYEEVKASIRAELLPFKQQQTVENFTKQLAAKAKVEVLPDNFYRETFGVRRTQGAPQ